MEEIEPSFLKEVYRYLGYKEGQHHLSQELKNLVEECVQEVQKTKDTRSIYSLPVSIEKREEGLMAGGLLMEGEDVKIHLEHCNEVVFMAVTLGMQIDRLIRRYEVTDMARAVILDAAANVSVEEEAQKAEERLRKTAGKYHKYLTMRFSPGYGDFPITFQKKLLNYLDASRKIGLSAAPSQMMVPGKSITAVLGLSNREVTGKRAGCANCVLREKCIYRKRGMTCETE